MSHSKFNVLFLCTGNSSRSIMAEGLMNGLNDSRFKAHSAGSHPNGQVNAMALRTLSVLRMPTSGLRSKSWDEFAVVGSPIMDFVFTICDAVVGEPCPLWPGQPLTAHWGVPDPGSVTGSAAERAQAFLGVAMTLKRRIELLLALPLSGMERLQLQHDIRQIGTR